MAVPDRALRSALEFAVGLAAAGQRTRPPLAFPAGLKPFLKVQLLPANGLAAVRAAVEGDPTYLATLGKVATSELVDEVGMLWLTRPDGWEAAAEALLADDEREREEARGTADARREQRRREAAETAAQRALADLAVARDLLEAERAARAAAEAEQARLRDELAVAKSRVGEGARAARRTTAEAAAEELAVLRAELAEVVAARDAALADRAALHGDGPVDLERVRMLLTEALVLSKGGIPRARQRKRKPIAVPGGLYGNSVAAATHVLRTAGAVVLVDGYNVAKTGWPALSLEQQRTQCIELAESLARRWGTLVHIVFDGADVVGATAGGRRLVRVSYSPAGVTADDVLRAEVEAIDSDRPVVVVTSDQAVVHDVRAAGANTVASDIFLEIARN